MRDDMFGEARGLGGGACERLGSQRPYRRESQLVAACRASEEQDGGAPLPTLFHGPYSAPYHPWP
jgi:hypothetical protein